MIKLIHQRDPGSVREMPMRDGFSIKPKNKEASQLLTPQNIVQEFQMYKVKVNSNNNKSREKVIPFFCDHKSFARYKPKRNYRTTK